MAEKSVAQKLQVREGQKLLMIGSPKGYAEMLAKQLPKNAVVVKGKKTDPDVIQAFITSKSQLSDQLGELKKLLSPKGILWVTYPKLTSKLKADINRDVIREDAPKFGLNVVAAISVDEDWTALRLKPI